MTTNKSGTKSRLIYLTDADHQLLKLLSVLYNENLSGTVSALIRAASNSLNIQFDESTYQKLHKPSHTRDNPLAGDKT